MSDTSANISVVHKHVIKDFGLNTVELAPRASIVEFGHQAGQFVFWEIHEVADDKMCKIPSTFVVVGTGHPSPAGYLVLGHRGTCFTSGGSYVWHLLELAKL